jgi:hypothetical protein
MTDIITIKGKEGTLRILGQAPREARFFLRKTIEDIGDAIEKQAKLLAPHHPETGSTGLLKLNPITRDRQYDAKITTEAFGGGFSVRGRTGFIGAVKGIGDDVAFESITINTKDFPYAKFVHEGTGIYNPYRRRPYGPRNAQRMTFFAYGRRFALKLVRGQEAQPYLKKAYDTLNHSYIPAKIEKLRAEIAAIT